MLEELDILESLRRGEIELQPLKLELAGLQPRGEGRARTRRHPDAFVDVRWQDRIFRFVAELKAQATPKAFRDAVEQAVSHAEVTERLPMILVPYLAPDRVAELESRGISGVDLCGNGIVVVPPELLVMRTGKPNQYPARRRIRRVYQGASSLVARVFLARPAYAAVQEVMDEVRTRGGDLSLSTVSKVLKVLEEDLVIRREGRASSLLQAGELLDRLAASFEPPRARIRKSYRWNGPPDRLPERLSGGSGTLVLTGAASVERYSVMPRDKLVQCYCDSIEPVARRLGDALEESARFPDLELIETRDPTAFFDSRSDGPLPVASPVQCWLELHAGDKRQQDASLAVRQRILSDLRSTGWTSP